MRPNKNSKESIVQRSGTLTKSIYTVFENLLGTCIGFLFSDADENIKTQLQGFADRITSARAARRR